MKLKWISLSLLAALSSPAFSAEAPVKTCSTTLTMPDEKDPVSTRIEIYRKGEGYVGTVTQTVDGRTSSYSEPVELSENPVREGLTAETDVDGLNLSEALVVHAMILTEDPVFEGAFSAGLPLKSVRSAKVYRLGKPSNMGATAIVEGKDEEGDELGSFLGGFLVSPCR